MSKSVIYSANTNSQSVVASGSIINLGSIVRRYGCNCNMSGGNVVVSGCGYYDVDVNISLTSTGAGIAEVQIYKDGVAIPGASATVTTVADTSYAISIPAIFRDICDCESTITVAITGGVGNVVNAAISVVKL